MTPSILPCTHPAACLRDGACEWCDDCDDLREERDRAREALDEVRAVSDRHQLDAARLRAHVERLREALAALSRTPYSLDIHAAAEAALAAIPAESLAEAEALLAALTAKGDSPCR